MGIKTKKIENKHLIKHKTKLHILIKYLIVVAIFVGYFVLMGYKYGIQQGFMITALSWSFFVLGTPIADAGFLIDFPFRLVTNIKMIFSESIVWIIAIGLNLYAFFLKPELYDKSNLLILFKQILGHPYPFWSIIILSFLGTFISIKFGDELLDTKEHKDRKLRHQHKFKYKIFITIFLFGFIFLAYKCLLNKLGVHISL